MQFYISIYFFKQIYRKKREKDFFKYIIQKLITFFTTYKIKNYFLLS